MHLYMYTSYCTIIQASSHKILWLYKTDWYSAQRAIHKSVSHMNESSFDKGFIILRMYTYDSFLTMWK